MNTPDFFSNSPEEPFAAEKKPSQHQLRFWLIIIAVAIIMIILIRHHHFGSSNRKGGPQAVVTAISKSKDVAVYLSALGTVTPLYNVTVKTQINGRLLQVFFREGQMVKVGELIAQIDPRTYQAQLLQYQGQLTRDTALLANAKLDLQRYQTLYKQDSISQQILNTQESLVRQYEGAIKTDQGLIDATLVNLNYCSITSPVDGRIGLRLVDPGNFVQVSDATGLVIINTLNPITIVFSLPEDNISQIMKQMDTQKTIEVKAYDRTFDKLLAVGKLLTIDNQIDVTTGTVKLKAQFQNNDYHLFPNQFVNVRLLINTLHKATVVPTAAIQYGTKGSFVYIVNSNNTVSVKNVTVGVTSVEGAAITAGLLPGQFVVTEGADKLFDGAPIKPPSGEAPAANKSSTGKKA